MIKTYYPDIRETLFETTLENGLKILMIPKPGFAKTEVELAVKFGSLDEIAISSEATDPLLFPQGIAHFIEHLLFESEEANPTAAFARIGAAVNAYTTYDKTNYYFSTTNHCEPGIKLLLEMVMNPRFTQKSIDKEAKIIAQEITMYEDDFDQMIYNDLMKNLYKDHPIRNDIAGNIEGVAATDMDTLMHAYHLYYHPTNMFMIIVGDIDCDSVMTLINEETKKYPKNPNRLVKRILNEEVGPLQPQTINKKKDVSIPMLMMGLRFSHSSNRHPFEDALEEVKLAFLLTGVFGKGAKPYQLLSKKRLINDSFEFMANYESTYGHLILYSETKKPDITSQAILEVLQSLIHDLPSPLQFQLAKRKLIGEYLEAFNNVSHLANFVMEYFAKGINLFDFYRELGKIQYSDLQEVQQLIQLTGLTTVCFHKEDNL